MVGKVRERAMQISEKVRDQGSQNTSLETPLEPFKGSGMDGSPQRMSLRGKVRWGNWSNMCTEFFFPRKVTFREAKKWIIAGGKYIMKTEIAQ